MYKSDEEEMFSWWLDELCKHNFVESYTYEPEPIHLSIKVERKVEIPLKTKIKDDTQFVLHPHKYTFDFLIQWREEALNRFVTIFESTKKNNTSLYCDRNLQSYIEIKPGFDYKNMTREVMINIKWVYDKHGIYINLVKPPVFFKDSFTPMKLLFTKTGKPKKLKHKILTIQEFLSK